MLQNGYIDTSVQKGFIEKLAGCIEHCETLHHALLDARKNHRNICVSWLDLANAYGSVRHSMIMTTLEWYYVPDAFAEVIYMYYEGLCASVLVGDDLTRKFRFQIGVFQGCTLSTMLFDTAFNPVFERVSQLRHSHGYKFSDVDLVKLVLGYADDIAIMTGHRVHNQEVINVIQEWLEWSVTMKAKPRKCKSTCLSEGKPVDPKLTVAGELMAFIGDAAFKFLGRQITSTGDDSAARAKIEKELEGWVAKLDKQPLTGSQKMWIFDCVLMSMVSWDLLIHDMSPSFVDKLGALQTRMYKKWCHYAKSAVVSTFYRPRSHYGLGMKEMVPFHKKMQLVKCHLLKTSSDEDVRTLYEARSRREHENEHSADPVVRRAYKPCVAMEPLLNEAKHRKMFKAAPQGKGGLGMAPPTRKKDTPVAEERAELLRVFEQVTEEHRHVHCLGLTEFAEWVKWNGVLERNHDWSQTTMLGDDELFQFVTAATEDVLPTPSVLKCWGLLDDAKCHLCGHKRSTLKHILCGCQVALKEGRQLWRHDSVLLTLYEKIRTLRNRGLAKYRSKVQPKKFEPKMVSTLGNTMTSKAVIIPPTLFETSDDWQLQFDVCVKADGQTKNAPFPPHIVASKQRPDGVIWSDKLKQVVWIELTSPWEENMTKWYYGKHDKYTKLARLVRQAGWTPTPLCVEVGCRGYINNKWHHMSKALGMSKSESKKLQGRAGSVAQRCSFYLYHSRKNREWIPRPLLRGFTD